MQYLQHCNLEDIKMPSVGWRKQFPVRQPLVGGIALSNISRPRRTGLWTGLDPILRDVNLDRRRLWEERGSPCLESRMQALHFCADCILGFLEKGGSLLAQWYIQGTDQGTLTSKVEVISAQLVHKYSKDFLSGTSWLQDLHPSKSIFPLNKRKLQGLWTFRTQVSVPLRTVTPLTSSLPVRPYCTRARGCNLVALAEAFSTSAALMNA